MRAGFDEQRQRIKQAGLELAPGELLAAATGVAAGKLNPVTRSGPPEPEPGDTGILLGRPVPAPVIRCG